MVCPSTECWYFDGVQCVLKPQADCGYQLGCTSTAMVIVFNHNLFGTVDTSNFENPPDVPDDSCDPEWISAGNSWSWERPLGTCGQIATHEGGKIEIAKTLEISGETYRSVTGERYRSINPFFMWRTVISVKVTFTCIFDATLSTTLSTSMDVSVQAPLQLMTSLQPHLAATGAISIGASLGGTLSLKYFKDETFTTEADSSTARYLGEDQFVQTEWAIKTLSQVRFFVTECSIREGQNSVRVIDRTCYSQTIRARPLGDAASSMSNGKAVGEKSQFKFASFTMSNRPQKQQLECGVAFCILTDGIL